MGELYGRWSRALDSNLAILTTAKLYTFDSVATATPKTTYSDAALTTAHANPISADASGRFPQVFAGDGQAFYLVLRSNTVAAGGVIVEQFNNVQSLGSAAGDTLQLDFGTGGKWQVRGDSGTGKAHLEFGDPDPDVVGGSGYIGGWLGTQLDDLQIDVAAANVTGKLKEGGFKFPGIVRQEAQAFSAAATVDIPLTNDPTGVRVWDIDIIDLIASASPLTALQIRFSYNSGVSYVSTATYHHAVSAAYGTTNEASGTPTAGTEAVMGVSLTTPANTPGSARIRVVGVRSGAFLTHAEGKVSAWESPAISSTPKVSDFACFESTGGVATHIRIFPSSGTISGIYRVNPQRGFGET